ncbi:MAG: DUF721 domain-containing protein [Candidatus Bipolaricaulota bacterium]|nr:MAG: DUF721 domain-containing protein [Candidatus Bipolaricaulota bacterium]
MNEIEAVLQRCGLKEEFDRQRALLVIEDLLPERLRPYVTAEALRQDVLVLGVSSSSVIQELSYLRDCLVRDVNNNLGREVVRRIRFRPVVPQRSEDPKRVLHVRPELREEAASRFDELEASPIREAFSNLYVTEQARQETLLEHGGTRCTRCGVVFMGENATCPGCAYDPVEGSRDGD